MPLQSYEMKDSGVEWIGEIPKGWYASRLKFLLQCPLQYGANASGVEYDIKLPRYIRITDITQDNRLSNTDMLSLPIDEASDYILEDKDILLARSGATAGKAFLYRSKYGLSAFAGYLIRAKVDNCKVLPEYVYYSTLGTGYDQWKTLIAVQATIPNIGANKYNEYSVPVPSLSEQSAIVEYLDEKCAAIDEIIAEAKATIDEYKSWKASVIFEAVTKGLNPNAEMKDSGVEWIGRMPKHWPICKIKYLCSMQAGKNLTSEDIQDSGTYPVYGGNGLRGYYSSYNQNRSCLLVGRQGALCGNVHYVSGKFWATDHAVVTIPSSLEQNRHLYYLLVCMNLNQYALNTAAQPGLSVTLIQNLPTLLTPLTEQTAIAAYLDEKCAAIDGVIAEKEALIGELESYKKSLIFETVTGKRRVC